MNAISITENINAWKINQKHWVVSKHALKIPIKNLDFLKETGQINRLSNHNKLFGTPCITMMRHLKSAERRRANSEKPIAWSEQVRHSIWANTGSVKFLTNEGWRDVVVKEVDYPALTLKSTSVSVCFRGISRLPPAFVFLRWFKLAHISIQVCTFHDGWKQGIDQ